jgi:crossover junction endodeoxyribonuclease RuvC
VKVCGIDPGISGALGLLEDRAFLAVTDMPTKAKFEGNDKKQVDGAAVAAMLREWAPDLVVIEAVHASPTYGGPPISCRACGRPKNLMAPSAAFNFGDNFGMLKGVVQALGIELVMIGPVKWKNRAKLIRTEKEDSRALAARLFPGATDDLKRKKDNGRAEALLIAFYGGFPAAIEVPRAGRARDGSPFF